MVFLLILVPTYDSVMDIIWIHNFKGLKKQLTYQPMWTLGNEKQGTHGQNGEHQIQNSRRPPVQKRAQEELTNCAEYGGH